MRLAQNFFYFKICIRKNVFKLDNYSSYEDLKIIRKTDYNIEYVYFSHLKHRNIKYYLHELKLTRDGRGSISNFHKH